MIAQTLALALNNGIELPALGLGVFQSRPAETSQAVEAAIRTGYRLISPGAVATELPQSVTEPDIAQGIGQLYEEYAIPADAFARAVAFAIGQPDDVDINEI